MNPILPRYLVATVLITMATWSTLLWAGPPSAEESARRKAEIEQIQESLAKYATTSDRMKYLEAELASTEDTFVREKIVDLAVRVGGDELETMLIRLVRGDPDVRIRIVAVEKLARYGTSLSIRPLLDCAEKDPTGRYEAGCAVGRTNARRNAYFALAEIGFRIPLERKRIAAAVRKIPVAPDELADVKIQTLYILTGNKGLLTPFFTRLKSPDPKIRVDGVVAFRFLKLRAAPRELTALIRDKSQEVRSWVALVLGEIGDPRTVPLLIEVARDNKMDRNTRCNAIYSLGRMRARDAEPVLRQLLLDDEFKVNAAISISQITGKRHPLIPKGYRLGIESQTSAQPDAPADADRTHR
jgi:HEAT repeat protein